MARRSPLPQDDKSRMCSLLLILFGRKKRIWSGPPNCGNCFVAGTAELCGADDRATPAAGGDHVTVGRVECEDRIFGGRSAGSLALSQALGGDRHHSRGSVLIARAPGGWLRRDDVRGGVVVAGGGELNLLTGKSRRGSGGLMVMDWSWPVILFELAPQDKASEAARTMPRRRSARRSFSITPSW